MKRIAPAVVLITLLQAVWPALAAEKPLVVELWPGKVPDEPGDDWPGEGPHVAEAGPQTGRGHRADPAGDQRHQADHHDLSAGEGQGHRRRGRDLPGRRLLGPLLGAGRRGSRGLAQCARRDGHHPQVPGAAPPRRAQGGAGPPAAAGCPAGHQPGARQGRRLGHRPKAHRHDRLLGGRPSGAGHGHELREANLRAARTPSTR